MQTSRVGGSSVTLQTAEAVKPQRPAGPVLVITFTAAPSRAMASRNASLSTILPRRPPDPALSMGVRLAARKTRT